VAERTFARGQVVWLDGRQAIFADSYSPGAAIVRFEGERQTRVVPIRKLQTSRDDSLANTAPGKTPPSAGRNEPPAGV
jgi:hypothetical protein